MWNIDLSHGVLPCDVASRPSKKNRKERNVEDSQFTCCESPSEVLLLRRSKTGSASEVLAVSGPGSRSLSLKNDPTIESQQFCH
jgi:hypothetical protein